MRQVKQLEKKLAHARFIHLLIMYILALMSFLFTNIPHNWWILLTILVISAGIEPGLVMGRLIHRVRGTFFGLLVLLPLLYLLQINYRLIPVLSSFIFIGLMVSTFNFKRYDIAVFFTTLAAFFLIDQSNNIHTAEGPLEIVINRGICTLIGAMIVIIGDYILFNAFQYSQKSYLLHQYQTIRFLKKMKKTIFAKQTPRQNRYLLINQLRNEMNVRYTSLNSSAESLLFDLKTTPALKEMITDFQENIWELRKIIFSLLFSELILKTPDKTQEYLKQFNVCLKISQYYLLKFNSIERVFDQGER